MCSSDLGLLFAAFLYFENKVYTEYEVIEQIERRETEAAEYEEFQGNVLQYTQDGAVYSSIAGEVYWNQTYEMETPRISRCEDYVAIYEQGGSQIYILNTAGLQGTIKTTIPVQRVSIAREGTIAVLMEDSQTSYIHMYNKDGKKLAGGELHIENSGYPLDLALSRDALKLAVSLLDIHDANVKSTVVFYNYGPIAPAQAGGTLQHCLGDVQVVVFLVNPLHVEPSRFLMDTDSINENRNCRNTPVKFTFCLRMPP